MNIVAAFFLALATFFGFHQPAPATLGAFTPVGGNTYYLSGAGITSSATTIQLTAFQTPDGRNLIMSMFGTTGYAALEPGTSKIEDVTFTGITQNSNGTATLTGVSRGLDFISPYAASTTLAKAHSGGSTLILTNTAGFYGQQFLFANNISTSTAVITFSAVAPPAYDVNPTFGSNALALIDKAYADSLAFNGAATSTETNLGLVQLATMAQVGSSTASTTFGGPLVIENKFATTTPGSECTNNIFRCIVATNFGKIASTFIDQTAGYVFTGTFSIAASASKLLTLNGLAYAFPTAQSANAFLTTDGSGNLSWTNGMTLLLSTTTSVAMTAATTTLTTTSNHLVYVAHVTGLNSADNVNLYFNTDRTGSYGWRDGINGGAQGLSGITSIIGLGLNSTTSPSFVKMDIWNESAQVKQYVWSDIVGGVGAAVPDYVVGAGVWNNTSSQITTLVLTTNSANKLNSGTTIYVYGSK